MCYFKVIKNFGSSLLCLLSCLYHCWDSLLTTEACFVIGCIFLSQKDKQDLHYKMLELQFYFQVTNCSTSMSTSAAPESQLDSNNFISGQRNLCRLESNRGHLSQSSVQMIIPLVYPCMKWPTRSCITALYLTVTVCIETRTLCVCVIRQSRMGSSEDRSPDHLHEE